MDKRIEKSFDFATETTKQVITLSTGIVTLSITFLDSILGSTRIALPLIYLSWILFIISILFGLVSLMSLTGSLGKKDLELSIYSKKTTIPAIIQIISFFIGVVLMVIFGICNAEGLGPSADEDKKIELDKFEIQVFHNDTLLYNIKTDENK